MTQQTTTIWVCENCLYAHAYDETLHDTDPTPLTKLQDADVTLGITEDAHDGNCELNELAGIECDCTLKLFADDECEGCNQTLAGERHALTLWTEE